MQYITSVFDVPKKSPRFIRLVTDVLEHRIEPVSLHSPQGQFQLSWMSLSLYFLLPQLFLSSCIDNVFIAHQREKTETREERVPGIISQSP